MTKTAIVENISFRLREGADESAFLAAMKGLEPFLERNGGVTSREVSRDATGLWTDRYVWEDMTAAQRADATFKQAPEAGALMPFFAQGSLTMGRAEVVVL